MRRYIYLMFKTRMTFLTSNKAERKALIRAINSATADLLRSFGGV